MRTRAFSIFFVVGLVSLFCTPVFAGPWDEAYWSSQNPYIYHFLYIEVWETTTMHQPLDSLELEGVNTSAVSDPDVKAYLEAAIASKSKAMLAKSQCEELYENVVLELPPGMLAAGVFGPAAFITTVLHLMAVEMLSGSFAGCADYGTHWKAAMDSAEKALDGTRTEFLEEFAAAHSSLLSTKTAGLCDDDFTGSSKGLCKGAELGMAEITSDEYRRFGEFVESFEAEGRKNAGNFSGYADAINAYWVDARPALSGAKTDAADSLKNGERDYDLAGTAATGKMAEAKQKMADLRKEKIALITESAYSAESTGTLGSREAALAYAAGRGDLYYANATFLRTAGHAGYLKDAINGMKNAYGAYEGIAEAADSILSDAEQVVEAQRLEAESEIGGFEALTEGKAPSSVAKALYESALWKLEKGDSADTFGERFYHYSGAAEDARRASVKQRQTGADVEAEIKGEFEKTGALALKARKDGIDVYLEEAELKTLEGINAGWVAARLVEIQEGILEKAWLRYGYLEAKREGLLEKIALGGGNLDDLEGEMEKTERNAFVNGRLDVSIGIGRLAEIALQYQYVEGEIAKEMKTIVANGIRRDVGVEMGEVELDLPVSLVVRIFLYNPYGFEAKGVMVRLSVPVELKENEITEGAEYVASATYSSGGVNIYLKEVGAYESKGILFEKEAIIAPVLKKKTHVAGNPDGSADADEKIDFELVYDVNGVSVPAYFESWAVDGKAGSGRKTGRLFKGGHSLYGEYRIEDAFYILKGDYRALGAGLNSEVSYDLTIVPRIGMDSTKVIVSEGGSDAISGFSVTSYSGAAINEKKSLGNGLYYFEAAGLDAGENAVFRVKYTIANSTGYVTEQLGILKGAERSNETQALIDAAVAALANNDTRRAVENIEKAKEQIEKERDAEAAEAAKLGRAKEKIEQQGKEVEKAIEAAKNENVGGQLITKLEARKEAIDSALGSATLAGISDFDYDWAKKEALAIRKSAFEKYNELKGEYLEMAGGVVKDGEFAAFEEAMARLEGSGKLEDAVLVQKRLDEVETLVLGKRIAHVEDYGAIVTEANALMGEMNEVVAKYAKEYDAAKGSSLFSLFGYDYRSVQKELKALENLVGKKAAGEIILERISDLRKQKRELQYVLDYLAQEGPRKLDSVKSIYGAKKDALSEGDRKLIEQGIFRMEEQISRGAYAEAIGTGDAVLSLIGKAKEKDQSGMIILGITALLVIGAIAIYLMRGKGGFGFGAGRSGQKILRKLKGAGEE